MALPSLVLVLLLLVPAFAASVPHPTRTHPHAQPPLQARLPSTWYHPQAHPAHALFRRDDPSTDGVDYASVGSPAWSAPYPTWSPVPSDLPQPWVDAFNAAVAAGKIPDYAPTTMNSKGLPVYASGLDPTSDQVCSGTYKCRIPGDIWDAPDGTFGCGFDDGPLPPSPQLYQFLRSQGVQATHFMIGVNIIANPTVFLEAFQTNGDDIGVHTWTHPYMTTLSSLQVLGELGWTMQLIHNSTGGRLPKYWRPPYGDSDTRVRAIAKEVFGLTTIFWNEDTNDWTLGHPGGSTVAQVNDNLTAWISGPKSPGLIILEHELTNFSVNAFIDAFPLIGSNNWKIVSTARLADDQTWWNLNSAGSVDEAEILAYGDFAGNETVAVSTASTTSSATPSSSIAAAVGFISSSASSSSSSHGGPTGIPSVKTNGAAAMSIGLGAGLSWPTVVTVMVLLSAVSALSL